MLRLSDFKVEFYSSSIEEKTVAKIGQRLQILNATHFLWVKTFQRGALNGKHNF